MPASPGGWYCPAWEEPGGAREETRSLHGMVCPPVTRSGQDRFQSIPVGTRLFPFCDLKSRVTGDEEEDEEEDEGFVAEGPRRTCSSLCSFGWLRGASGKCPQGKLSMLEPCPPNFMELSLRAQWAVAAGADPFTHSHYPGRKDVTR